MLDYSAEGEGILYFKNAYKALLALQERYVIPYYPKAYIPDNYEKEKPLLNDFFDEFNNKEHGFKFIISAKEAYDFILRKYPENYSFKISYKGLYFDTADIHPEYYQKINRCQLLEPEGHIVGFLDEIKEYLDKGSYIKFNGEDGQKFLFHVGDFIKLYD